MPEQKIQNGFPFIQYAHPRYEATEMQRRSDDFHTWMDQRRTVRDFSEMPIPVSVLENLVKTASTAPSGAHKQPWTFCLVTDPAMKKEIRIAAEAEEKVSYDGRMSDEWLQDLAPLQTDLHKPFLETAPCLIVVFRRSFEWTNDGKKKQNYYVSESCGLACGFLLAAVHHAGLVALTHTPSPMNFLSQLLKRPENEKPFLLIPVGYPADDCWVPDLQRKQPEQIIAWYQ